LFANLLRVKQPLNKADTIFTETKVDYETICFSPVGCDLGVMMGPETNRVVKSSYITTANLSVAYIT
jgi:hypothetical protein